MADEKDQAQQQATEMPPVSFLGHVSELVFTARAYLGGIINPDTNQPVFEPELARRIIDTVEMLREKTKGNLTAPERNYLDNVLYELRMQYVRMINNPPKPSSEEPSAEDSPADAETSTEAAEPVEGSEEQAEPEAPEKQAKSDE